MRTKQKILVLSISIFMTLCLFSYSGLKNKHIHHDKEVKKQEKIIEKIAKFMADEGFVLGSEKLYETARSIYRVSKQFDIDYRLMLAIIKIESNFKHNVVSPKGARGLFQIKPSLAKFIAKEAGVNWGGVKTLDEPEKNIKIGVFFFSKLMDDFENVHLALNAYNLGPTKMKSILAERDHYNGRFAKLVLREYKRISSILPPP